MAAHSSLLKISAIYRQADMERDISERFRLARNFRTLRERMGRLPPALHAGVQACFGRHFLPDLEKKVLPEISQAILQLQALADSLSLALAETEESIHDFEIRTWIKRTHDSYFSHPNYINHVRATDSALKEIKSDLLQWIESVKIEQENIFLLTQYAAWIVQQPPVSLTMLRALTFADHKCQTQMVLEPPSLFSPPDLEHLSATLRRIEASLSLLSRASTSEAWVGRHKAPKVLPRRVVVAHPDFANITIGRSS